MQNNTNKICANERCDVVSGKRQHCSWKCYNEWLTGELENDRIEMNIQPNPLKHTHCLHCNNLMPESLPPHESFCSQVCYSAWSQNELFHTQEMTNEFNTFIIKSGERVQTLVDALVDSKDFCKSNSLLNTLNNEYN